MSQHWRSLVRTDQLISAVMTPLDSDVRRRAQDDIRAVLEQDLGYQVAELRAVETHRGGHGSCDGWCHSSLTGRCCSGPP